MAVTESVLRTGVSVKLNNGVNPSGGVKVVGVSLGKVAANAPAQKVMNVVGALAPLLSLSPVRVERTVVSELESE